jgi:hypothetical protein
MKRVVEQIEISRPASAVFDFIERVENNQRWKQDMRASGWTTPTGHGVGATYTRVDHLLGRDVTTTFEITGYEPGRLLAVRSEGTSSFPPATLTTVVDRIGDASCRVTVTNACDLRGAWRLLGPIYGSQAKRVARRDFDALKRVLEAEPVEHHGEAEDGA